MVNKFKLLLAIPLLLTLFMTGCASTQNSFEIHDNTDGSNADGNNTDGNNTDQTNTVDPQPLKVVSSFTIITDIVNEIGGDSVITHNLVPTGTDPHEYVPLPKDLRAATDADLLLYNGLNLEGGKDGWFARMAEAVGQSQENVVQVSDRVEALHLGTEGAREEAINPHSFTDPNNGVVMAQAILAALQTSYPERAEYFEERASNYLEQIYQIESDYTATLAAVPEAKRILVTSERAFQYLADRYDIEEAFLWQTDTDETGSVEQIKNLVNFLKETEISYLVVESNVDTRPMQTVSLESGVPIYPVPIFSDEIGSKSVEGSDSYLDYLKHNLDVLSGAFE